MFHGKVFGGAGGRSLRHVFIVVAPAPPRLRRQFATRTFVVSSWLRCGKLAGQPHGSARASSTAPTARKTIKMLYSGIGEWASREERDVSLIVLVRALKPAGRDSGKAKGADPWRAATKEGFCRNPCHSIRAASSRHRRSQRKSPEGNPGKPALSHAQAEQVMGCRRA